MLRCGFRADIQQAAGTAQSHHDRGTALGYALSKPRVSTQRLCAWCVVCVLAATTRSACRGPGAPGQHAAAAAPSANGGGGCVLPCPLLIGRGCTCSCSCSCSCCVGGNRTNSRRDHITGRAAAGEAACRRGCCGERCGHTGSPSPHRGGYARCVVCWTPTPQAPSNLTVHVARAAAILEELQRGMPTGGGRTTMMDAGAMRDGMRCVRARGADSPFS